MCSLRLPFLIALNEIPLFCIKFISFFFSLGQHSLCKAIKSVLIASRYSIPAWTLHTNANVLRRKAESYGGIGSHSVRANARSGFELRVTFRETWIHWIAAKIHYHFIYSRPRQMFTFHIADKQLYAQQLSDENHSYFHETIRFSSSSRSLIVFANCKSILFVALELQTQTLKS